MFKWTPYVMVRICLFFAAGILLGIYKPNQIGEAVTIGLVIVLLIAYGLLFLFFSELKSFRIISGVVGLSAIFLLGYLQLLVNTESKSNNHLIHHKEPITYYEAIIKSAPESKAKSWKLEAEIKYVKSGQWKSVTGRVLLYLSKASFPSINWEYGSKILVKGTPRELTEPANPFEFDYKRFLSFKNIYHQHFLTKKDIINVNNPERKGIMYYSIRLRARAVEIINQFVENEQSKVIAQALVLGVTDGIDNDLQNAYAASGAMHVLAVSGLHVGIIYGIIIFLFKPMEKLAWSRWLVFVLSVIGLWLFAFVTGLSPSVLRAVTMFSFIALARPLGWQTNIYNTLAGSAFLLLLYNPFLIMSVGFQLSYLAVIGIVYFQQPIYNLLEVNNKYLDWFWKITCISIAAQLSTFALGMLYFHQFPVYFLVSNLFVIPLSEVILVLGILLLMVSPIKLLAIVFGKMIDWCIVILNWIVFKVERLPFSLIEEIPLSTFQCWLIILILLGLILLVEFKSMVWLYFSFFVSLILVYTEFLYLRDTKTKNELIVYNINEHFAMEWQHDSQAWFVADSALQRDTERIRFHIRPGRLNAGIRKIHTDIPFKQVLTNGAQVYQWHNLTLLHIHKPMMQRFNFAADIVVVSYNSLSEQMVKSINASIIVFDGTNADYRVNQIARLLPPSTQVHYVKRDKAFKTTLTL